MEKDMTEQVMEIIMSKIYGSFLPRHDKDLPMFKHCCEGMIEVKNIQQYEPIFLAHNIVLSIRKN